MSLSQLCYNTVIFSKTLDGVEFRPNLICPNCRTYINGVISPTSPTYITVLKIKSHPVTKIVDTNGLIKFRMPCCGLSVELYVAIHDDSNTISVTPIKVDWYNSTLDAEDGV